MPAYAFDTLKAMRTLTDAGMQEPVAEAVVTTMNDAAIEGVATKTDLANLELRLAAKIETETGALKSRLDAHQWVLGFIAAGMLLMAGRMFGAY